MMTVGLWVTIEARPGREQDLAAFLERGATLVEEEPLTAAWFALRVDQSTFAIFDAFAEDAGRRAHLSGAVAQALASVADDLLAAPPRIRPVDVVAARVR